MSLEEEPHPAARQLGTMGSDPFEVLPDVCIFRMLLFRGYEEHEMLPFCSPRLRNAWQAFTAVRAPAIATLFVPRLDFPDGTSSIQMYHKLCKKVIQYAEDAKNLEEVSKNVSRDSEHDVAQVCWRIKDLFQRNRIPALESTMVLHCIEPFAEQFASLFKIPEDLISTTPNAASLLAEDEETIMRAHVEPLPGHEETLQEGLVVLLNILVQMKHKDIDLQSVVASRLLQLNESQDLALCVMAHKHFEEGDMLRSVVEFSRAIEESRSNPSFGYVTLSYIFDLFPRFRDRGYGIMCSTIVFYRAFDAYEVLPNDLRRLMLGAVSSTMFGPFREIQEMAEELD